MATHAVRVRVIRGVNLSVGDKETGSSDPFVEIIVADRSVKTEWIRQTLNPVWNATLTLEFPQTETNARVVVWDYDTNSKNDLLGETNFSLHGANVPNNHEKVLLLPVVKKGHPAGEIEVGITGLNYGHLPQQPVFHQPQQQYHQPPQQYHQTEEQRHQEELLRHQVAIHRFWNEKATDHFYTTNATETGAHAGYQPEGVAFKLCSIALPHMVPVHRYWSPGASDHFYTANASEIGTTTPGQSGNHGYTHEGILGYISATHIPGTVPVYRYYREGDHFYTAKAAEIGVTNNGETGNHGYKCEGILGYAWL